MVLLSKKILISVFILVLTGQSLSYGILRRQGYVTHLKLTDTHNALYYSYPSVNEYNRGLGSWLENRSDEAVEHFRSAIVKDVLFVDAWIKLAETHLAKGNRQAASDILSFTEKLTAGSFYRKWKQTLLAFELQHGATLIHNTNFFLSHQKMVDDCLYLSDQYFEGNAGRLVNLLGPANRKAYFQWLLRWRRMDDCATVWPLLMPADMDDDQLRLAYAHRLIQNKEIAQALEISQGKWYSDTLFNGSFEKKLPNKAYGWRYWTDDNDEWRIKRVDHDKIDGYYALQIYFKGASNIAFNHFLQIVPVAPNTTYRLSYWWKSDTLTTDQRPFFDIFGFDTEGFHEQGPMVAPNQSWSKVEITFHTPEQGQAIVARLRRKPSKRIDNKLRGRLLLDHFQLLKINDA